MEQVGLLPSGVQLWSKNVVACRTTGDELEAGGSKSGYGGGGAKIALCSSLAVFVYDVRSKSVTNILAGYEGVLSALAWSPHDARLLVTACEDGRLVLWDIVDERRVSVVSLKQAPVCMAWFPMRPMRQGPNRSSDDQPEQQQQQEHEHEQHQQGAGVSETTLAVATSRGSVILWNAEKGAHTTLVRREAPANLGPGELRKWKERNRPTVVRCNRHAVLADIAVGFKDGRIELVSSALERQKRPVTLVLTDASGGGPASAGAGASPAKKDKDKDKARGRSRGAVSDVQWDPFSPNYLLAAYTLGPDIVLWDCAAAPPAVMMRFKVPGRAPNVLGLAWQSWAPGSFMSVSEKSGGVMHVWNVSQRQPVSVLQVSTRGTSPAAITSWGSLCAIPLENGAVVAFDARKRLALMETKPSHRETVFDVRFCPRDANTFATASFDGRVMIYDVRDMSCTDSLKHKDGPVVYGLSWAPGNANRLASCTFTGVVSVWDTTPGRQARLLCAAKLHTAQVYRVDWNSVDAGLIATSSADKYLVVCRVHPETGALRPTQRLKHAHRCFGCEWTPFYSAERPWVAVGCEDAAVHVWNAVSGSELFRLAGHSSKIFNVAWSPLEEGLLASGSDDKRVMVWRVPLVSAHGSGAGKKPPVVEPELRLYGHTRNVRALRWSSEVPDLLMSGSWDGSLRLWDTRLGAAVTCVRDHHADVYGLDVHPARPFTVLSSSRDTTIRVWEQSLPRCVAQTRMRLMCAALYGIALPGSTGGNADKPGSTGGNTGNGGKAPEDVLKGEAGKALLARVRKAAGDNEPNGAERSEIFVPSKLALLQDVSDFFGSRPGSDDFWALLRGDTADTTEVHASEELVRHHVASVIDRPRQGLSASESSDNYVQELCKVGHFRTACTYLREHGEWDRALALAPAVSVGFWRQLTRARATALATQHEEAAVKSYIAAGEHGAAIRFYADRGQFDDAMLLAQVAVDADADADADADGRSSNREEHEGQASKGVEKLQNENKDDGGSAREAREAREACKAREARFALARRDELARAQAKVAVEQGLGVRAACSLLAVRDPNGAVRALALTGQEELAAVVAELACAGRRDAETRALAAKCERLGMTDLALALLRRTAEPAAACHLFCARNCARLPAPERQRLGLRQREHYLEQARETQRRSSGSGSGSSSGGGSGGASDADVLVLLAASGDAAARLEAADLAVEALSSLLRGDAWHLGRAWALAQVLHAIDVTALAEEARPLVLALCTFVGALRAMDRQLHEVVMPMLRSVRGMLREHATVTSLFPVSVDRLLYMETSFMLSYALRMPVGSALEAQALLRSASNLAKVAANGAADGDKPLATLLAGLVADIDKAAAQLSKPARGSAADDAGALNRQDGAAPRFRTRVASARPFSTALPGGNLRQGGRSLFDGSTIRGPSVQLNDCGVFISLSQATQWAECSPFSPVGNGAKIFHEPDASFSVPKNLPPATKPQVFEAVDMRHKVAEGLADRVEAIPVVSEPDSRKHRPMAHGKK